MLHCRDARQPWRAVLIALLHGVLFTARCPTCPTQMGGDAGRDAGAAGDAGGLSRGPRHAAAAHERRAHGRPSVKQAEAELDRRARDRPVEAFRTQASSDQ